MVVAGTTGQRSTRSGHSGRCRKKQWSSRYGIAVVETASVVATGVEGSSEGRPAVTGSEGRPAVPGSGADLP